MTDVAIMVVGIVIGIGIFKTPSLVANFVPATRPCFIGVGCWAGSSPWSAPSATPSSAASRPNAGGEYHS